MGEVAIKKEIIQSPDASRIKRAGRDVCIIGCRNTVDATSAYGTRHVGVQAILKSLTIVRSRPNRVHLSALNSSHKVFPAGLGRAESLGFVSRRDSSAVFG